jgi:DNA replication protein DnaC
MVGKFLHGFAILEEGTGTCEQHGEYQSLKTRHGWSDCGACQAAEAQKRQQEAADRLHVQRVEQLLEYAKLPQRFKDKTLNTYRAQTKAQERALGACRAYFEEAAARVRVGACLVLLGPPGTGKTHLLCAMVRGLAMQEVFAVYATAMDVLKAVRGSWAWHGEEHGQNFVRPTVLALDEVWTPSADRDRESLVALLDERYRAGKPTLVASNLTWKQMQEQLGARFCDRLHEGGGLVLAMDGRSMRSAA